MAEPILRVAVPAPLMRRFDYLPPVDGPAPAPGQRVRVPFGRSQHVGVITAVTDDSALPRERLRRALEILDVQPLLDDALRELLDWAAGYYHHPLGEVYAAALPVALRRGSDPTAPQSRWFATDTGQQTDLEALGRRAPLQARLLQSILDAPDGLTRDATDLPAASWRRGITALTDKGLIEPRTGDVQLHDSAVHEPDAPPVLNSAQTKAIATINRQSGHYGAFLLEGVTGSGKTEIYLHCIQQQLTDNRQSLVLVPE
ncbi:MAG TPA: primosomal protein N', partial [Chromatiales bacterium]|nr:primosomal protein N' [Chromatiales bacterium]